MLLVALAVELDALADAVVAVDVLFEPIVIVFLDPPTIKPFVELPFCEMRSTPLCAS